jgi:hypothetical protein
MMESRYTQLSMILLLLLIILPLSNACSNTMASVTEPDTAPVSIGQLDIQKTAAYDNPDFEIMAFHEPHFVADVFCLTCHTEHNGVVKPFPETCLVCHTDPIGSHEAHGPTGVLECTDCHGHFGDYIPHTDDCLTCHTPLESHPYLYDCSDCHND